MTRFSPVQIAPNYSADQGLPCTATIKLATPRQDTLLCDLRTQISSTSDQIFSVQIAPNHAGQGVPCTATRKLATPRQDTLPCDLRIQTSSTSNQTFPVRIVPNHAGQGSACTATRKLAAPRQDTLPCDLRTQTSSTSDQVFPCPNCSKPCRSRIALYSRQKACHTQTGHSPL